MSLRMSPLMGVRKEGATSFTHKLLPEPRVSQAPAVTMCGKMATIRSVLKMRHVWASGSHLPG